MRGRLVVGDPLELRAKVGRAPRAHLVDALVEGLVEAALGAPAAPDLACTDAVDGLPTRNLVDARAENEARRAAILARLF